MKDIPLLVEVNMITVISNDDEGARYRRWNQQTKRDRKCACSSDSGCRWILVTGNSWGDAWSMDNWTCLALVLALWLVALLTSLPQLARNHFSNAHSVVWSTRLERFSPEAILTILLVCCVGIVGTDLTWICTGLTEGQVTSLFFRSLQLKSVY